MEYEKTTEIIIGIKIPLDPPLGKGEDSGSPLF